MAGIDILGTEDVDKERAAGCIKKLLNAFALHAVVAEVVEVEWDERCNAGVG